MLVERFSLSPAKEEVSHSVDFLKPCANFNDDRCLEFLFPLIEKYQILSPPKGASQRQLWTLVVQDLAKTLDQSKFRIPLAETLRIQFSQFRSKMTKKYWRFIQPDSDPPVENVDITNHFHFKIVTMLREAGKVEFKGRITDVPIRATGDGGRKRVRLSEIVDEEDDEDEDGLEDEVLFSESTNRIFPEIEFNTMMNTLQNARSARYDGRRKTRSSPAGEAQEGDRQINLLKLEMKIQERYNISLERNLQLQEAKRVNLELELQVKAAELEVLKVTAESFKLQHREHLSQSLPTYDEAASAGTI